MSDKIIFLDFDGVLNTEHYQNYLYHEGKPWQDEHGAFFDPETVEQLRRIIDITHADIVVESSWKYLGLEAMQEMWEVRNIPGRVIDITPSTVSDSWLLNANIDELNPAMGHCKGMEIASWLSDHADKDTRQGNQEIIAKYGTLCRFDVSVRCPCYASKGLSRRISINKGQVQWIENITSKTCQSI